jgi:hypothetical protein
VRSPKWIFGRKSNLFHEIVNLVEEKKVDCQRIPPAILLASVELLIVFCLDPFPLFTTISDNSAVLSHPSQPGY